MLVVLVSILKCFYFCYVRAIVVDCKRVGIRIRDPYVRCSDALGYQNRSSEDRVVELASYLVPVERKLRREEMERVACFCGLI